MSNSSLSQYFHVGKGQTWIPNKTLFHSFLWRTLSSLVGDIPEEAEQTFLQSLHSNYTICSCQGTTSEGEKIHTIFTVVSIGRGQL